MLGRTLFLVAVVVAFDTQGRAAVNPPPQVVPAMQEWSGGEGTLVVRDMSVGYEWAQRACLEPLAEELKVDYKAIGGTKATGKSPTEFAEVLLTTVPLADKATASKLGAEGYKLAIDKRITITANTPTGLFYGTRTLLQMLAQNPKHELPKGTIIDYPVYRHRMLMLDVGRKPFPIDVLKDYLRIMAWYKMNELHLHLSDEAFGGGYTGFRVECDTFPGLTSKDCFYTKKQLRELQDMAHSMGITITPEIDMPGHARVFSNYWPDLALKGQPSYLDVSNPQTIERLKKLLDEMIPIFDAPDFHIGTDEYRVGGPRQEELHEAFRKFINTMNAHIRSKGKNCRIWSGFENMRGKTQIDPSVIIDMWETRDAKGQIAKGHSIINSSDGRTYIVPGAHYYGVSNAGIYNSWEPWMVSGDPKMNPAKDDPKLLGGKLHIWCDQGPTGYTHNEIARLALPSIQVFAEKLWGTKGSKDFLEFQKRAEVVRSTGFSRNAELPPEGGAASAPIPDVTVLDREIQSQRGGDGIVVARGNEETMAARDDCQLILLPNPPSLVVDARPGAQVTHAAAAEECRNLENPWTLTVDVLKTAEAETRGVILSSDLAEICTDYTRVDEVTAKGPDGKPVKRKVTRRGIGILRAAGAPGKDVASSYLGHDVNRVYSEPLPLNKWTTITVVGQQRRTTVYINGEKVGESGEQMLCPLAHLGSTTGQSFEGKIRNLKVWDRALSAKEIGRAAGLDIPDNLAAHCPVTASASDTAYGLTPDKITDEELGTRWSSGLTQAEQWVAIDLQKPVEFNTMTVAWEAARPKKLRIQIPRDKGDSPIFADTKIGTVPAQGQDSWKDVCDIEVSGDKTVAAFPTVQAAKVRLLMSQPVSQWGYSIWEVEVLKKK